MVERERDNDHAATAADDDDDDEDDDDEEDDHDDHGGEYEPAVVDTSRNGIFMCNSAGPKPSLPLHLLLSKQRN